MKRTAGAMVLLAALSGWGTPGARAGNYMSHAWDDNTNHDPTPNGIHWGVHTAPAVPAVQGPWGQPVPMAAPYSADPPSGTEAHAMMVPVWPQYRQGYYLLRVDPAARESVLREAATEKAALGHFDGWRC